MTLPYERSMSVTRVRQFLLDLASSYGPTGIKRIPKAVRIRARLLLKHYPTAWEMAVAAEKLPELFSKLAINQGWKID